jgi:hypothetical protein
MRQLIHKTFAERIACDLGFSEENTRIFVSGSIGPDSHADFPHATGKNKKILSKIETARALHLQNDEYAYGELGNALHYIQDKWVSDSAVENELALTPDDDHFLESIKSLTLSEKVVEEYLEVANALLTVKNRGIEAWFNHSWGIWHKDYSSCIYVFADIVEMMLPTLQPNRSITENNENLKTYVLSEAFNKATREGFLSSIMTNFLYPKLAGYPAAMYFLALISPPSNLGNAEVNLNMVYRLSLEIARYTVSALELFKYQDTWTLRTEKTKQMSLTYMIPQYHVLIPKPVNEVQEERRLSFYDETRSFIEEWPKVAEGLPALKERSEKWKIILSGLVEFLGTC